MKTVTSSVAVTVTIARPFGTRGARVMVEMIGFAIVECVRVSGLEYLTFFVCEAEWCREF